MESCFGDYITKEYGLLKQILSYLEPCDLWSAKLVCRDWRNAVESISDKNPISLTDDLNNEPTSSGLTKQTLPDLVIHQHPPRFYFKNYPKKCLQCKQAYVLCPCAISGPNTTFISLNSHCRNTMPGCTKSQYLFWQKMSVFLVPSSPRIRVSTYFVEQKAPMFKEPITDEVLNRCIGGEEPIKCLLVITRELIGTGKATWIGKLLNRIVDRQGVTFAVGGGDVRGVMCKKGNDFSEYNWIRPGLILITFRGDAVSAHSDIITPFNEADIEAHFEEFSSRVGPVPEGGSRMAFIAQCVDRIDECIETCESAAFQKAFPSVPEFGFRAYGEYGIRSSSSDNLGVKNSSKRTKMTFDRAHTSSLVILTFKKV